MGSPDNMHHLTCAVREINAGLAEDVRVTLRSASVQKTFVYSIRWSHEELWIRYRNPFLRQSNPMVRRMCLGLGASSSRHAELEPFTVAVYVCVCAWGRETECVCHKGWGICVCTRARRCHLYPLHNDPLTSEHPFWITGCEHMTFLQRLHKWIHSFGLFIDGRPYKVQFRSKGMNLGILHCLL